MVYVLKIAHAFFMYTLVALDVRRLVSELRVVNTQRVIPDGSSSATWCNLTKAVCSSELLIVPR